VVTKKEESRTDYAVTCFNKLDDFENGDFSIHCALYIVVQQTH